MNRLTKLTKFVLFVFFIGSMQVFAHEDELEFFHPVKITKGQEISMTDCVSLAYQNSPKIKRQKYNLDIARSHVGIARAGYFPVINAGVRFYNENNSDSVYHDKHYRDLPSVGVGINKMVWDFGKTTANIKMEEFYKIGAEYEFMDSLCSTLFDVKWKYYNLLKTKALLDIEKENLKLTERTKNDSKKSPDKEVADIYINMAKVQLSEAENNYKNAKVDLNNSMYLINAPEYSISNTDTFNYDISNPDSASFVPHKFPFEKSNAAKIAYKNSPDLHVLIATKRAMEQSLLYIKRSYLPTLDANVVYGYNKNFQSNNNSLQVGVNLNSSVNLMELKHSIKGADAQLNLAQNEIDLFKKDLFFEIQRAFNNVEKSQVQIQTAKTNLNKAKTAYGIVEKQYNASKTDYTSYHDAREDFVKANQDYVNALYSYNTALIRVEMAMHCHLVDIHHKSGHAVHHHSDELISNLIKALECQNANKKESKKKSLLFGNDTSIEDDEYL